MLLILSALEDSLFFNYGYRKPAIEQVFIPTPDYTLNVGDRILVTAYSRRVSVVQYETFVDNNGFVPLEINPLSKPAAVKVVGLTLDSAQKVLLKAFRKYVPSVNFVSIQLISPSQFYVALRGNFDPSTNGFIKVNGLTRLFDVLSDRRLVLPYSALSRVVLRGDTFNVWKFLKTGDVRYNPLLKANDTIYLSRTDSVVYAVGDFSKGEYWTVEVERGDKVYDIALKLNLAGRLNTLKRVLINGREVDLNTSVNVGDTLSFDFIIPYVIVIGAVNKPSGVTYAPYKTVQDYIIESYGLSERANIWDIRVKHQGEVKAKRVSMDYRPAPGDVIIVGSTPLTLRDLVFIGPSLVSAAVLIYTTFFRR